MPAYFYDCCIYGFLQCRKMGLDEMQHKTCFDDKETISVILTLYFAHLSCYQNKTILEDDGCPTMSVSICQDLKKQICCLSNMTSICQETSFTAPTKSIDVVFLGPPGAGKGTQVYFP